MLTDDLTATDVEPLAARVDALVALLEPMAEHLARVDALLSEFEPAVRALFDPAATGPLAWAIRKRTR